MHDPWHGTHDDRPDWDRPSRGVLLSLVVLTWTPVVYAGVWVWRRLR